MENVVTTEKFNPIKFLKEALTNFRNRPRARVVGVKKKSLSIYSFDGGLYRYELDGNFSFKKTESSQDGHSITVTVNSKTDVIKIGSEAQANRIIKKIRRALDPIYIRILRAAAIVFSVIVIMNMINGDFWAPSTLNIANTDESISSTEQSLPTSTEPSQAATEAPPSQSLNSDFGLPDAPFAD